MADLEELVLHSPASSCLAALHALSTSEAFSPVRERPMAASTCLRSIT